MASVPGVLAAGEVGDGCRAAVDAEGWIEEQDEEAAQASGERAAAAGRAAVGDEVQSRLGLEIPGATRKLGGSNGSPKTSYASGDLQSRAHSGGGAGGEPAHG